MKLSQEIDLLYHDWVTSHDTKAVLHSFNKLYINLRKMTFGIIGLNFKKLRNEREDLFHEMMERTINAKEKNMINTVDFFSAWYRQVLMNHLRNAIKHKKRLKMKMIITEADMINEIDISKFGTCIDDFHIQEQNSDMMEIINQCLENDRDKELLIKKHVEGYKICELAIIFNSSADSIKSRLKRAKSRIRNAL